jgi:hypothetical protein
MPRLGYSGESYPRTPAKATGTGAARPGKMGLKIGGENVIDAIAFGSRWPNHVRFFLG